jgi:hypothetical protein
VFAVKLEGVAGLSQCHAGTAFSGQRGGLGFEGQGDIAAFAASRPESMNRAVEGIQWHPCFFVLQCLTCEFGKPRLNPRRFAVFYGVAENAIGVHEKYSLIFELSWRSPLEQRTVRTLMQRQGH